MTSSNSLSRVSKGRPLRAGSFEIMSPNSCQNDIWIFFADFKSSGVAPNIDNHCAGVMEGDRAAMSIARRVM
jgi:hypothetical protein